MKPIQEWTEQELKARAFEELTNLENCRNNIRLIQAELKRRESEPKNTVQSGEPRPA